MRSTLGDKLVVITLLALLVSSYWWLWRSDGAGETVVVKHENQTLAELSLTKNQLFHAPGHLGASEIEVKNGAVRFLASPCANQLCVNHGWISHNGAVAACLPNRISLQVKGVADAPLDVIDHVDAINH